MCCNLFVINNLCLGSLISSESITERQCYMLFYVRFILHRLEVHHIHEIYVFFFFSVLWSCNIWP